MAALCCFATAAADLKVDHVTVAGRDLKAMQAAFDAVGIRSEFGGKHTNGMTEMAIASFPDGSYLELIAAQPGAAVDKHYWGHFIKQDAGACAWAVSVKDLKGEASRLKQSGIDITPAGSGRARPDGVALRWVSASIGPGPQGSFFPFFIQDETPRQLRAYPHGSPSAKNMDGIALVVIAVRDLDSAIRRWREVFALGEAPRQNDDYWRARLAWFPGTPVLLAAAADLSSWLSDRLQQFGEAPCAFVLRSRTLPSGKRTSWFQRSIAWFDPSALHEARIGVTTGDSR